MEASSIKSSQKLLQKFAPFRKRQLRYASSNSGLNDSMPSVDEIADSLQAPSAAGRSQISLAQTPVQGHSEQQWIANPAPSYSAFPTPQKQPAHLPIPPPKRVSSVNREAMVYGQHQPRDDGARDTHSRTKSPTELDGGSIGSRITFDDDMLRPQTPVSPLPAPPGISEPTATESPILGHSSNPSRQSSVHAPTPQRGIQISYMKYQPHTVQANEQSRRESRPPTPADSTGKASENERFPQPPQARLPSPPASKASSSLHAPTKLGIAAMAQLQVPAADKSDVFETELNLEDDPESWDVINPNTRTADDWDRELYSLEKRAEQLYSSEHLHTILEDKDFHFKFATFLRRYRPHRLPILAYYWDACKAIRALTYANSLTHTLSRRPAQLGEVAIPPPGLAANGPLHDAAQQAFNELLGDDLHWYIASTYIEIVRTVMQSRVTGNLPAPLREASHGLAEVFCITDPTRRDNPIILASPAFTRHSGCGMDYILGRNCRFMQGPGTTVDSCRRFAIAMQEGRDHSELFVNYRRDGSPFLSMVMNAQLMDSQGKIRYYLGAQVDVSGLLKNCSGLESLTKLVEKQEHDDRNADDHKQNPSAAIKALSEMLNGDELEVIRGHGGILQKGYEHELQSAATRKQMSGPARVVLAEASDDSDPGSPELETHPRGTEMNGAEIPLTELNLSGVYSHYLLIRPAPSLRVLFASPTLRMPGVLQSQFLHRIGGTRMRQNLDTAFQEAKVVTAKVRWLKALSEDGEGESSTRWLHCTPLMHHTGRVGLWMIVVVMPIKDKEGSLTSKPNRQTRQASDASWTNRPTYRPSDAAPARQEQGRGKYVPR